MQPVRLADEHEGKRRGNEQAEGKEKDGKAEYPAFAALELLEFHDHAEKPQQEEEGEWDQAGSGDGEFDAKFVEEGLRVGVAQSHDAESEQDESEGQSREDSGEDEVPDEGT